MITRKITRIKVGKINDVQAEMKQMIIDSCLDDATKSATEVAKHVFETTVQKYEGNFFRLHCNMVGI